MNYSPGPIEASAALPREPFIAATDSVNQWRGKCLEAFSRAEAAVTETLLTLAPLATGDIRIELPHLVGERFEALAVAMKRDSQFAKAAGSSATALASFRKHEKLRILLCHGVTKVTLSSQGKWTIVLRLLALRCGKEVRERETFDEEEATAAAEALIKCSQHLCSQLGNFRYKVIAIPNTAHLQPCAKGPSEKKAEEAPVV